MKCLWNVGDRVVVIGQDDLHGTICHVTTDTNGVPLVYVILDDGTRWTARSFELRDE